jgi:hypothetical protein
MKILLSSKKGEKLKSSKKWRGIQEFFISGSSRVCSNWSSLEIKKKGRDT